MSVITNFKKRQQFKAQKEQASVKEKLAQQPQSEESETTALTLLAQLLNVSEEKAINEATKYVESNINYFGVDPATGEDRSALVEVTKDDNGNITHVEGTDIKTAIDESTADLAEQTAELATELSTTADAVQSASSDVEGAASDVEGAAEKVSDSASDLAYTAEDINAATDELKEVAAEIKKPSAAQKSTSSKKANAQKNSSKK